MRGTFRAAMTAVCAFALAIGMPAAHAENALAQPSWDVQIQGGFLWRKQFTPPVAAERVDIGGISAAVGTDTIEARNNWTGRLGARRRLDQQFDFGFAYSGTGSANNRRSLTSDFPVALIFPGLISSPITSAVGGLALDARTTAIQHIVDIDAGYDVLSGGDMLKVIGGVRLTYFAQTTNLSLGSAFFPVQAEFSHRRRDEFVGAGPRLGAQWSHDLGAGFSLNTGASGSLVFGQQKFRTSTTGFSGITTGAFNDAHGRTVYNGEGELSLAYSWTDGVNVSVGYQASAWFGLRDNRRELDAAATLAVSPTGSTLLGGGRRYPIDLYHGPFIRFGFKW
jgi:hypothetical protein